jgi:hypothetical protein
MNRIITLLSLALTLFTSSAHAEKTHPTTAISAPRKTFPHPDRIRYSGDCMTIEGRDVFIYSAAFHYFRTPKVLWRDRLTKIKAAGFNTVETYVPWNIHEREMPKGLDDYSQVDTKELEAFLNMVHNEFGMYSIVRPGPFICAEWAGGGYPRWLAKFMPDMSRPGSPKFWLRSGDQGHIDWSKHWYKAICPVIAKYQLTAMKPGKKGVILVQIENEYNHSGAKDKEAVLRDLYKTVQDCGINVPMFTCLTNPCRGSKDPVLSQVFDSDNYYVGHHSAGDCAYRMTTLKHKQPDAPGMVTELQGGWFATIGGALSEDSHSDAKHYQAINIMSLLGGATIINPYMFVGGTHFAGWGARGQTTSYDYRAAIRECGAVGDKYLAAKAIGQFIHENEQALIHSHGGPCEIKGATKNLTGGVRIAPDGTRFIFFHNADNTPIKSTLTIVPSKSARLKKPAYNIDQHGNKIKVEIDSSTKASSTLPPFEVSCDLAGMDSKILVIPPGKTTSEGVWYPKPQPAIQRPSTLPQPVRIAAALRHEDPTSGVWKSWKNGISLPELGVSDHRYVRYRSQFNLTEKQALKLNKLLINSFSRDIINASVNGKVAKRLAPEQKIADQSGRNLKTSWERIGPHDFDNQFDLSGLLKSGTNTITLIYENIGHEHGYVPMEELSGICRAGLSNNQKTITQLLPWEISLDLGGVQAGWIQPGFTPSKKSNWKQISLDTTMTIPRKGNNVEPLNNPQDGLLTWYRIEFNLPATTPKLWIPWLLRINASGNGYMWLNGHNIGRHYEFGQQRDYYLPECWLHFGHKKKNILMLGLRQTSHSAVIRAAEIRPYPKDFAEIRK